VTAAHILAAVEKDIPFYDESGGGVTISGGEPLMQPDFLRALLRGCKERDIHTAVDTCGLANWETVRRIAEYTDLFLYDLKLMDGEKHRLFTGVSNELILSNLEALAEITSQAIIVRVPIVPGVNDDDDNVRHIGRFVASLPRPLPISLLPYHRVGVNKYGRLNRPYALQDTQSPSDERIAEIAAILQAFGLKVGSGG